MSSVDAIVSAVQALAVRHMEQEDAKMAEESNDDEGEQQQQRREGEEEEADQQQRLLEACCLVMLTERFPKGFLDEEAVAGLLVAADALDSVCVRSLLLRRSVGAASTDVGAAARRGRSLRDGGGGGGSGGSPTGSVNAGRDALFDAVTALRDLSLRLGRILPRDSPFLRKVPPGAALLRVIGPVTLSGTRSLVRASAALLPFLAERCAVVGGRETDAALSAVVRLGPTRANESSERDFRLHGPGHGQQQQGREESSTKRPQWRRLLLLHGVLGGLVAGEGRLLESAVCEVAMPMEVNSDDDTGDDSEDDNDPLLQTTARVSGPRPFGLDQRLFATVSRFVDFLPTAEGASLTMLTKTSTSPTAAAPAPGAAVAGSSATSVPPSLLLVWGDALRLSFLGTDAQRLVFSSKKPGGGGRAARSRTRWVEDLVAYLNERGAVLAVEAGKVSSTPPCRDIVERVSDSGSQRGSKPATASVAAIADGHQAGPSERFASCRLLRALCGCSHLLDPPLPRPAVRSLMVAFLGIAVAGERNSGGGSGGGSGSGGGGGARGADDHDASPQQQWKAESHLLQTSFCLLVQHASDGQLDEIVLTLLNIIEMPRDNSNNTFIYDAYADTTAAAATAAAATARASCMAASAVTLVRLAAQVGRGAAFKAVFPKRALSLACSLCWQLREANRCGDGGGGVRGGGSSGGGGGSGDGLKSATGALEALDGLLGRQSYSSIDARVVSVVLGSVEPAARAALHAAEISISRIAGSGCGGRGGSGGGGGGGGISSANRALSRGAEDQQQQQQLRLRQELDESARCFRACCHLLRTVLEHYARKVFSCTPPFAALCRSLMRLFFCLAAPLPPTTGADAFGSGGGGGRGGGGGSGGGSSGVDLFFSLEEQVAAASALSRVLQQFVPHKEVLKKYAAFLLLEYVSLAGLIALEPGPRAALLDGVFAVMEACTRREMRQLHGLLGALPTGQDVFRSLYEDYQLQHKYTGKM